MAFVRNWLLPILLATAQVAVWPGLAWWLGPEPDRGSVAVGLVATGLAAVALGRRRRSPVAALVAVTVVVTVAQLSLANDADLGLVSIGEAIALYSVTARRSLRLSLAVTPLVAINDTVLSLVRNGFARGRLGEAAAERLPGQPELLTQALTFTANTGRETLAALHRLVAVMDVDTDRAPPLLVRVAELADGFVRLGQPVTVQADGDVELVPPAVAEAVYGIVREALTNALRYAPGAAVTVRLAGRPETLELTIDDEGVACAGSDEPLGSGRGLTGMRERAEALGGSVAAGPRQAGGWTVAATLPVAATPPVAATLPVGTPPVLDQVAEPDPSSSPGWWRRLRHEQVIDAAIALAAVSLPLAIAISVIDEDPSGVAVVGATPLALMTLLLVAHGLPLLWRRQAPWRVLAAVALANCLWPVAVALKLLSPTSTFIAPGAFAACAAVYSVALWGRPDWATWISIPVAVLAITTSTATGLVLDPTLADQPPTTETVLFVGVGMAICAGPEILAVWGAGMAVRLRRGHTIQREHGALAVAATRAAYAARIERSRIAAGLRDSVLDLASSLTTTADAGRQALADGSPAAARERLTEASTQARAALAAMRELLEMLHSNHLPADRSPQPTANG